MAAISPVAFKRGSTFSFQLVIPSTVQAGLLKDWFIRAQLRREKNDLPSGFIAEVGAFWADPTTATRLVLNDPLTDKWPLGRAELDILFMSAGGQRVRSKTILFDIQRGITR